MYEESYVKELIAERDKAKEKARKLEQQTENEKKSKEEESLKAKGDYETLTKKVEEDRITAQNKAQAQIQKERLSTLAAKHGMVNPDDVALFTGAIVFDPEYNITNTDEVEKAFEEFKKAKPYLFKSLEKVNVPRVDNTPIKKVGEEFLSTMSKSDLMNQVGEEMLNTYRGNRK